LQSPKRSCWHFTTKKNRVEISLTIVGTGANVRVAVRENTTTTSATIAPVASTTMKTTRQVQEVRMLANCVLQGSIKDKRVNAFV
jgi:hypothetical protein